jgi:chromosome segregation ATPase
MGDCPEIHHEDCTMKTETQTQTEFTEKGQRETGRPAGEAGESPNSVVLGPDDNQDSLSLVQRLDPAIGEATSVVGAMLTELLRRTLRGGVMRIGDEMHGYVSQKVDTVITERTPALEQRAVEVAEHTARTAATEVAVEEVQALSQRTQESDRELADRIEATARAAEEKASKTAETLATQIHETEQRSRTALEETNRTVQQGAEQTAQAQAALRNQVDDFIERAKEGRARFKAKLAELEDGAATLGRKQEALRQDLVRHLEESQARLREELRELRKTNEGLTARVAELEKPRGLRALFAWLFGRRKPKPAAEAAE